MNSPADGYCSSTSRGVSEQLFATVSQTQYWLLLEEPSAWGAKAFEESQLLEPVKPYLASFLETTPYSRLLLIKRVNPAADVGIRLYLVNSRELDPQIYLFQLQRYPDLLDLDLTGIFSGEAAYRKHLQNEPLYLVCTNGKRDPCCAKFGLLTYGLASKKIGNAAWQCSHIGGHRFAANLLCFPHGIYYGRVDERALNQILQSYPLAQLVLENYRGRACYPKPAQAAEYFLREFTNNRFLAAYRFLDLEQLEENQRAMLFANNNGSGYHRLHLQARESDFSLAKSCGDEELVPVEQYFLRDYYSFDSLDKLD